MGSFDDDLQPRLVGERTQYFYGTQGPVKALPIYAGGRIEAYAFFAVDRVENSAGFVARRRSNFPATQWYEFLSQHYAAGLTAEQAIARFAGTISSDGEWSVGAEYVDAPSKAALVAELNPDEASGRAAPAMVSAEVIDAVLRGEQRATREVEVSIDNLDQAVRARPTMEPLVVAMPRTRGSLPTDLSEGVEVFEPTYLRTVIASKETQFPGAEVVLRLRLESGMHAIFVPSDEGTSGTLLVARGLRWAVTGVVEHPDRLEVFGRALGW